MEKIKVMIVGNNDHKIYEIKSLLGIDEIAFVGFTKQGENALEKVMSLKPNVVLIQCDDDYDFAFDLSENIYVKIPGCAVIVIGGDVVEVDIIKKAMHSGVRKVLDLPIDATTLIENIKLAHDMEKTRVTNTDTSSQNLQSKIITVFGAKGGIGKTTIAVNLAVALAKMGKKIAIVDTDLQFGDVNVFFDIDSKDTISELSENRKSSDIDAIKRYSVLHYSGVSVLCAPKSPEYAEYVTAKQIEVILNTMRPYFDYIIVDTTPLFNDSTMIAIESANLVLLVSGMDISTLRNTKTTLGILDALKQKDKVEVIINRIASAGITLKDIERVLEVQVKNKISFDFKTALSCHNKGVPIVIDAPRSTIARELVACAKNVMNIIDEK
jgi:pilus assembly protein CpaE